MTLPGRKWSVLALVLAALAAGLMLVVRDGADSSPAPSARLSVPNYRIDTDHQTFPSVGDLRAGAPVILVGTVESHSVVAGTSPGVDGAGDPLPAVPHTEYVVRVDEAIKGAPAVGTKIVVSLSGGATPQGNFVLDGGPILDDGIAALFFLEAPLAGKYYPLAGGAAVAAEQPDGGFVLPADATGQAAIPVSRADLFASSGGGGGGGNGNGLRAPSPDAQAPRMSLAGSRHRQKLGQTVFVMFSCPEEACTVDARAKLKLPKVGNRAARSYGLKRVRLHLQPKVERKVAFRLSRALRGRVADALDAGRTVAVEVKLSASDGAQNVATRGFRVLLGP
jgi:hypothetical protein